MFQFRTEYVGDPQDKDIPMPKSETVREILDGLWDICSGERFGNSSQWSPYGEFSFRERLHSKDRIFRASDFEGKRAIGSNSAAKPEGGSKGTVADGENDHDGGPGCGGLDLLGKYTFNHSAVTKFPNPRAKLRPFMTRHADQVHYCSRRPTNPRMASPSTGRKWTTPPLRWLR
jgi:hypothetical protein